MNRDQIMAALSSGEDVSDYSFFDDSDADPYFNLNLSVRYFRNYIPHKLLLHSRYVLRIVFIVCVG